MECKVAERKMLAWLHDELPLHQRAEIAEHIAACAVCAERAASLQEILDAGQTALKYEGPCYSYHQLQTRMHQVTAMEEVYAWVPKLRVIHPVPRFALAMFLMGIMLLSPLLQSRLRPNPGNLATPLLQYRQELHHWERLALNPTEADIPNRQIRPG